MSAPSDSGAERNEKFITMTTAPVEKLVLSLAGPTITIMLITALYNMADTYFVSSLGTSQVGAVGIAFPLMAVIQALGFFFGQGSGNYMSRALGKRDIDGASRMAATSFISGFCFTTMLAVAGLIGLGPLVGGLGATETIRPYAMDYIFFILFAAPWMVAATVMNQQLRFQGSASIAMVGMLTGAILNIFLDPLLIFVFHMGVRGAAVATMISQMVSFFILSLYGSRRKGNIPIRFKLFTPTRSLYGEMFRGGIPALIRQSFMSIATVIINHFARPYGDAAIAAISITTRLSMFATSVVIGFGQGFQPVCGFNYGAKLFSRVRKAFWFCIRFGSVCLLLLAVVMAIFAPQIIALFRKDDLEVIAIGAVGLRLQCISLPVMAVVIMVNMMTQTTGKALEASIVAISWQGLFLIPTLFFLTPSLGLVGIQLAKPVADMASLIMVVFIMRRMLKVLSVPDGLQEDLTRRH